MGSELVPDHPDHERFDAVARSVVAGGLSATLAVLVAVALGWSGSPAGWLLVLAALPAAAVPYLRWRTTSSCRLPVGHLDPAWADVVAAGASAAERIQLAADDAPSGAVADHLHGLHETACRHVRAMHDTASAVAPLTPPARRALLADAAATTRRLTELADAADRLRDAQQRHLGPDPIAELVEATDRLTASLRDDLRPSG